MHNHVRSFAAQIAESCLADLDEVAWRYVHDVREISGYLDSVIDDAELFRAARGSLEMLFGLIIGDDLDAQLMAHSDRLGRRRARQGIPLDSLLRAVRMDFRFLWNAMRGYVAEEDLPAFAEEVVKIWDAVEVHTMNVHAGYMAELADMDRELELARAFLLRRLLEDGSRDIRLSRQAAESLGLDPVGSFLVVVGSLPFAAEFRAGMRTLLPAVPVDRLDGSEFAILDVGSLSARELEALHALPVGLPPIAQGAEEIGDLWRVARDLAALVDAADRAATLDRHWDRLFTDRLGAVAGAYSRQTLEALHALPEREQSLLIEAVREYLANGSVTRTAAALYCHRNTVLNRLTRFALATGLDPTVPADAGAIRIVLSGAGPRSASAPAPA
ncbi:helix-turn-helix domain-containing protein [Microbacterium sp. NPDC055988]|uniref:helix-turn-helix domain-containing protein n=1 Tax=Microbacterium sp. NPDC055988 TaxID=3345671 RepID=UPI0035DB03E6